MPEIEIAAKDGNGAFNAYIAVPETTPAPGLVMIQEIFGVNREMRDKCDAMAREGYVAISPDLFWRQEPGVQLTDKTDEEWQKAFTLMQNFDTDRGVADLQATLDALRGHEACNGKAGDVGYCLGGKLAYLMAARTNADASVGYYGVQIDQMLDEAQNIGKPLLLHVAEEDEFVDREAQQKMKDGLADHPQVTLYSYPGVMHAFARGEGVHYDADAAQKANARTKEFLETHLKG